MKHFKTNRHQQNKDNDEKNWTIDTEALEEQSEFNLIKKNIKISVNLPII